MLLIYAINMVNKDLQRCYVLFAPLKINISLNGSKSLRWFLAEDKKRHDSLYTFLLSVFVLVFVSVFVLSSLRSLWTMSSMHNVTGVQ